MCRTSEGRVWLTVFPSRGAAVAGSTLSTAAPQPPWATAHPEPSYHTAPYHTAREDHVTTFVTSNWLPPIMKNVSQKELESMMESKTHAGST